VRYLAGACNEDKTITNKQTDINKVK